MQFQKDPCGLRRLVENGREICDQETGREEIVLPGHKVGPYSSHAAKAGEIWSAFQFLVSFQMRKTRSLSNMSRKIPVADNVGQRDARHPLPVHG